MPSWESLEKHACHGNRPGALGHTGVYAFHHDDCRCSMGGHQGNPEGSVRSCCGQTARDARRTAAPAARG